MSKVIASSHAVVRTGKAQAYLIQLCKHFGHKVPATHADNRGRIPFGAGTAELDATDAGVLKVAVSAADESLLGALEDVVERHLRRFAFKEEIVMAWVRG